MKVVSVEELANHLGQLLEYVARGQSVVIERDGVRIAQLSPLDANAHVARKRTGFLVGEVRVPDDFDEIGRSEIERCFAAGS